LNLKDILNTDMNTLGRSAREGFSWWIEELSGLVPASWRPRSARPSLVAQPTGEGGYRLTQDGAPIMASGAGPQRVDLVLPRSEVLVREIELPLLSPKDTRHMVALDIARLSPMPADAIYFDTEMVMRDDVRRRQTLLLGVIERGAPCRSGGRSSSVCWSSMSSSSCCATCPMSQPCAGRWSHRSRR
jgi:hypothetical protein